MPNVQINPTTITGQVNLQSKPPSTQQNFRQMCGSVMQWNPDAPIQMVQSWLNNAYRKVIDRRLWYGLMVRGQVTVPSVYTVGTISVTSGSNIVTGNGTAFTQAMVGQQIRAGFSTGIYTIASYQGPTQVTLDLPWGNQSLANVGYSIFTNLVSLGSNIKFLLEMVNQRQGYRLYLNVPQSVLNFADTWRTATGWTYLLSNREASSAGWPQYELYPTPTFQQAFPFLAYIQPLDMSADGDAPVTMFRSDVLVLAAIADALLFRKDSRYYNPEVATYKVKEFQGEVEAMARNDDNLYPKDQLWDFTRFPFSQQGGLFLQSHAEYS